MEQIIKVYNRFHLGDHIFNFILFYNIKEYIETHNIKIEYYCLKKYHYQVSEFNCSPNITILEYNQPPIGNSCELWLGNRNFEINISNKHTLGLDTILCCMFNEFLINVNIPILMKTLEYTDPNLLDRCTNINTNFANKYQDIDFLIFNSVALSGQYNKEDSQWNPIIYKLSEKYKVVTTTKVEGIPCTFDDNLTVKDIASLSTKVKKIIAVNSGVVTGLFNTYTLNNIEVIYYFDNNCKYEHPKFIRKHNINDLYCLLDS